MSFLSFLKAVGKDIEHGLAKVLPIAQAVEPFLAIAAPGFAPIYNATVGVVVQTEQKWAAIGKQDGTGQQKLAEVVSVLGPIIQQGFSVAGKPADPAQVQAYINAVVALLNSLPAPQ